MSRKYSGNALKESIKEKCPGCEYYVDENSSLHDVIKKMCNFGLFNKKDLNKEEKEFLKSPRGKKKALYTNERQYFLLQNNAITQNTNNHKPNKVSSSKCILQ